MYGAILAGVVALAAIGFWLRRKNKRHLSATAYTNFRVLSRKELTHNTCLVEFEGTISDLIGPGMHLSLREPKGNQRPCEKSFKELRC